MSDAYRDPLAGLRAHAALKHVALVERVAKLSPLRRAMLEDAVRAAEITADTDDLAELTAITQRLDDALEAIEASFAETAGDVPAPAMKAPPTDRSVAAIGDDQLVAVTNESAEPQRWGGGTAVRFVHDGVSFFLGVRRIAIESKQLFTPPIYRIVGGLAVAIPASVPAIAVREATAVEMIFDTVGLRPTGKPVRTGDARFDHMFVALGDEVVVHALLDSTARSALVALDGRSIRLRVGDGAAQISWDVPESQYVDALLPVRARTLLLAIRATLSS